MNTSLKKSFKRELANFHSDNLALKKGYWGSEESVPVPQELNIQPFMVYFALVKLMGFHCWGKHEKQLWAIPILFKSVPFLLTFRKFGFKVHSSTVNPPSKDLSKEMLRKLKKSIGKADKLFQPIIKEQIEQGNITVVNKYIQLHDMYTFFRSKAEQSFKKKPPRPKEIEIKDKGTISLLTKYEPFKYEREGYFYTTAMLDAYFSRLEHLLVLVLPFIEFNSSDGNLSKIITENWTNKYKQVFEITKDKIAKSHYDALHKIKNKYRNTISHGLFEKEHASLFFHTEDLGAVPVSLSSYNKSIHYSLHPIDVLTFQKICNIFDDFDSFFKEGHIKYGVQFAEAGLDVSFSEQSRVKYFKAMESEESFVIFMEYISYVTDMHANMDW